MQAMAHRPYASFSHANLQLRINEDAFHPLRLQGSPRHVIDGIVVPDTESDWGVDEFKAKLKTL